MNEEIKQDGRICVIPSGTLWTFRQHADGAAARVRATRNTIVSVKRFMGRGVKDAADLLALLQPLRERERLVAGLERLSR